MTAPEPANGEVRIVSSRDDVVSLLNEMLDQVRLPDGAKLSLQLIVENGPRYHVLSRTFATVRGAQ